MAKPKKKRRKAYRPKTVCPIPPLLLNQEPSKDYVLGMEKGLRDAFLRLLMGSGTGSDYRIVLISLLFADTLVRDFEQSEELQSFFEDEIGLCIDALLSFEEIGRHDPEAVSRAKEASDVAVDIVSKATAKAVAMSSLTMKTRGKEAVEELIRLRAEDNRLGRPKTPLSDPNNGPKHAITGE